MPADRLLTLANHRFTAPLVRALGLPQPKPLQRRTTPYAAREFAGDAVLVLAAPGGFAAQACREILAVQGADLSATGAWQAIVVDATGCQAAGSLDFLHAELRPRLAGLAEGGRVLFLLHARPASPEAAACGRAVEGLMRSLAKEIGRRGATANALALDHPGLDALPAPLAFFCTARSTYVSGQVVQLGEAAPFPFDTHERVAVVTGAAGGIGAAVAERLAREAVHVVCVDIPAAAEPLAAVAAGAGGTALALDIAAPDAAQALCEALAARGGVDVLVHNAGITRDRTFARMSAEEWHGVMAVNLHAVLAIDRALDAAGLLRDGGREVCLASISGIAGNAGQANYAASKAALIGYVAQRARELATRGITVNAVAPGFIETAMTQRIPFMVREVGRRLNAVAQGGRPEDVAEAIAFLARSETQGITGQALRVCGQSFLGA